MKYKCLHCGEVYDLALRRSHEDIEKGDQIVMLGYCDWMRSPRYGLHFCADGTHSTSVRLEKTDA